MKFNINKVVKVKLTKTGRDEIKRQHEELLKAFPNLNAFKERGIDSEGYTRFQLHDLMYRLGHLCMTGLEPPFEIEIEIPDQ